MNNQDAATDEIWVRGAVVRAGGIGGVMMVSIEGYRNKPESAERFVAVFGADAVVRLWTCPDCAFTFDASHEDVEGGHSCPHCAEIALADQLNEARIWRIAAEETIAQLRAASGVSS